MRHDSGNISQWGVSSVKLQMELEVLLEVHLQLQSRLSLVHHASKKTSMLVKFHVLYCLLLVLGSATLNQLSCEVESSSVGTEIGFNLFSFYLHFPCVYSYFNLGTISYFSFNLQHSLGTESLFFILSKPFTAM